MQQRIAAPERQNDGHVRRILLWCRWAPRIDETESRPSTLARPHRGREKLPRKAFLFRQHPLQIRQFPKTLRFLYHRCGAAVLSPQGKLWLRGSCRACLKAFREVFIRATILGRKEIFDLRTFCHCPVLTLTLRVPMVAMTCILRGPDGPANQP